MRAGGRISGYSRSHVHRKTNPQVQHIFGHRSIGDLLGYLARIPDVSSCGKKCHICNRQPPSYAPYLRFRVRPFARSLLLARSLRLLGSGILIIVAIGALVLSPGGILRMDEGQAPALLLHILQLLSVSARVWRPLPSTSSQLQALSPGILSTPPGPPRRS